MTLPLFLTKRLKYPVGALAFFIMYLMYRYTNHHPVFTPRELPMLAIDRMVPFVPWTVLIYVSEYLFFTAVYLVCKDMDNVNKYIYSFFTTQALSCLIFFVWPTVFPRERFPIPDDINPALGTLWMWLRNQDKATNCFPSLHVSTVYLSVYIFRDEQREKLPFFLVWGTLIAFSTLPTKQHYFADILAGWALSMFSYWLFHRKIKYRRVTTQIGNKALQTSHTV
ncbi:MAG: phosphatase PAP2 family protein [Cryobacterium sp.]|nr:phosphatase PAP2 family protein [Oligoflexia bacterium]